MLKRIVTALILAPLFLLALFKLPSQGVQLMMGLILIGVVWEASSLAGFRESISKWIFVLILVIAGVFIVMLMPAQKYTDRWVMVVAGISCVWWLTHVFLLARFSVERPGIYGTVSGRAIATGFVLLSTWTAVNALLLHDQRSPLLLVYVLVMIWVADSGAYFAGRFFGSHKLAVRVSPGKTIEGVVGGVAAVMVFSGLYGNYVYHLSGSRLAAWLLLAVVVTLVSVVGDLNESALKRVMGKKDSGNILPGHGGFFDRVDAITAATPVFYFGWRLIEGGAGL